MRNELTTTALSVRKLAACRANWRRRGPLTDAGRERIRAACLRSRPWLRSTGPRTVTGKRRSRENAVTSGMFARVVEPFGTARAITRRLRTLSRESADCLDELYEALSTTADIDRYCDVGAAILDVLDNSELSRLGQVGVTLVAQMVTEPDGIRSKRWSGLSYRGAELANEICEAHSRVFFPCLRWHTATIWASDRLLAEAAGVHGETPSGPAAR